MPQGIGAESLRHLLFTMLIQHVGEAPIRGSATLPPIHECEAVYPFGLHDYGKVFDDPRHQEITCLSRDGPRIPNRLADGQPVLPGGLRSEPEPRFFPGWRFS